MYLYSYVHIRIVVFKVSLDNHNKGHYYVAQMQQQ